MTLRIQRKSKTIPSWRNHSLIWPPIRAQTSARLWIVLLLRRPSIDSLHFDTETAQRNRDIIDESVIFFQLSCSWLLHCSYLRPAVDEMKCAAGRKSMNRAFCFKLLICRVGLIVGRFCANNKRNGSMNISMWMINLLLCTIEYMQVKEIDAVSKYFRSTSTLYCDVVLS